MATAAPRATHLLLARRAREHFAAALESLMHGLADAVSVKFGRLEMKSGLPAEKRSSYHQAARAFAQQRVVWINGIRDALEQAASAGAGSTKTARRPEGLSGLSLVDHDVIEDEVISARLANSILEKSDWEIQQLRTRIQHLEGGAEQSQHDLFRPEVFAKMLRDQWLAADMSRDVWKEVQESVNHVVETKMIEAFKSTNRLLIEAGVLPDVAYGAAVKRDESIRPQSSGRADFGNSQMFSQSQQFGHSQAFVPGAATAGSVEDAVSRLNQVRIQAEGVMDRLQLLLSSRVADFHTGRAAPLSEGLKTALEPFHPSQIAQITNAGQISEATTPIAAPQDFSAKGVEQAAGQMRERSKGLKQRAETKSEKAIIEIVALMFDGILAEERLPSGVRVWFSRLQMPVLREALSDPVFFENLDHPARQLIDRMGSCVLGFEAASISDRVLEAEIKRIVQTVEQYPETGPQVYELVHSEFEEFLAKHLPERAGSQRAASVAQQVEQRETLLIQYTIELRDMLSNLPVRDQIRDFLFKTWAEVLAVVAIMNGPQHEDTIDLKKAAADLVWAASAKPNRKDRARVIQELPQLLARLRKGMSMMNLDADEQEAHIKSIGDTLADAFLSKTEAIPQEKIDAMAARLEHLEDYFGEAVNEGLSLDVESIELMVGEDASGISVLVDGEGEPYRASIQWAQDLALGGWFRIDHNGQRERVQYVWHSARKQLHLFSGTQGQSYLIQLKRLASYLQSGLLAPQEEESLTVSATRKALAKIDANPERLLD